MVRFPINNGASSHIMSPVYQRVARPGWGIAPCDLEMEGKKVPHSAPWTCDGVEAWKNPGKFWKFYEMRMIHIGLSWFTELGITWTFPIMEAYGE